MSRKINHLTSSCDDVNDTSWLWVNELNASDLTRLWSNHKFPPVMTGIINNNLRWKIRIICFHKIVFESIKFEIWSWFWNMVVFLWPTAVCGFLSGEYKIIKINFFSRNLHKIFSDFHNILMHLLNPVHTFWWGSRKNN